MALCSTEDEIECDDFPDLIKFEIPEQTKGLFPYARDNERQDPATYFDDCDSVSLCYDGNGLPDSKIVSLLENLRPASTDSSTPSKDNRKNRHSFLRRVGRKKPIGMPKRALSAYNLFFRKERRRLIQESQGSIGFEQLGKVVGSRWQKLSKEDRRNYELESKLDEIRYQREMAVFEENRRNRFKRKICNQVDSPRSSIDYVHYCSNLHYEQMTLGGRNKFATRTSPVQFRGSSQASELSLTEASSFSSVPAANPSKSRSNLCMEESDYLSCKSISEAMEDRTCNDHQESGSLHNPLILSGSGIPVIVSQPEAQTNKPLMVVEDPPCHLMPRSEAPPNVSLDTTIMPSGLQVTLPDQYGYLRCYTVTYTCYRVARKDMDAFFHALENGWHPSTTSSPHRK